MWLVPLPVTQSVWRSIWCIPKCFPLICSVFHGDLAQYNNRVWFSPNFITAGNLSDKALGDTLFCPLFTGPHHLQNHEAQGQVALCYLSRSAVWDFLIMNSNQMDYLFCILGFPGDHDGRTLEQFLKSGIGYYCYRAFPVLLTPALHASEVPTKCTNA